MASSPTPIQTLKKFHGQIGTPESVSNFAPRGLSDAQHDSIVAILRQEFVFLTAKLESEVRTSKSECLAKIESVERFLQQGPQVIEQGPNAVHKQEPQSRKEPRDPKDSADQHTEEDALWADFQEAIVEMDEEKNLYSPVMNRYLNKKSVWQHCMPCCGGGPPDNCLARLTENSIFVAGQASLILINTVIMGYEADITIRGQLKRPREDVPAWLPVCNDVFTIIFTAELLFRIIALRGWFFVNPTDWVWNYFDMIVVLISVITDFIFKGVNLSFVRTLRILRAIRAARIIRVLRFCRRLRGMLFAILSSLSSLCWFFLFLGGLMYMVSILLLQGLIFALQTEGKGFKSKDFEAIRQEVTNQDIDDYYGSIFASMFSLLCAVTGGDDWLNIRKPLKFAGPFYMGAFVIYILFVTVGIINVLTGVFVSSSTEMADHSLVVINEQIRIDQLVKQILDIFNEFDFNNTGMLDWKTFKLSMEDSRMQAYLSHLDLEPTHARMLFDLIDVDGTGTVDMLEFIMGFLRLKGDAKAVDARIIQRQIGMIPRVIKSAYKLHRAQHQGPL